MVQRVLMYVWFEEGRQLTAIGTRAQSFIL